MMIKPEMHAEDQARRLELKTQDQRLKILAVDGTGMSPWEAEVLVEMTREVYFAEPGAGPLRTGQMRYECVASGEGAGKPIKECRLVTVVLTLFEAKEDLAVWHQQGQAARRKALIQRLTEEAREQGGLLSQEDLALLLFCDVRTIRRDIKELREQQGIYVATRGQIEDIGPGVSHKGVAIGHWLAGLEAVEVARRINHTLHAVERYIHTFCRVVFLLRKGLHPMQIALTVGISSGGVRTFLDIYDAHRKKPEYARRFQEIDLIGAQHYEAEDLKKGGPTLRPEASRSSRRLS
jgi:biotin operon repressor